MNERVCNDNYIEIPVTDVIVHESYVPESRNQHHDIALLRMQRNVDFTDFIKPICLPNDSGLRALDFSDQAMEVVGFGKTETDFSSPRKLKVQIDGISHDTCTSKYSQVGIIYGQMCAGGEAGKDSW